MIKATKQREAGTLTLEAGDIERVAHYFTEAGDVERVKKNRRMDVIGRDIEERAERIRVRERDIAEYREQIDELTSEGNTLRAEIESLPAPVQITSEQANADMTRALSLPYIKSIRAEVMGVHTYIVATTRENALYTTLDRKYSRSERWYKSKPYKIPLPTYHIRVGLTPHDTLANNSNALGIILAEYRKDTSNWLEWIDRYNHEPRAHWGTRSENEYKGVCLGEYESEVSNAFKKSIADGLIALAVYLQSAGTESAYVHGRHLWALHLGKKEYNSALVPSEKEIKKLEVVIEEGECGCYDEDGEQVCDEYCECDCHN